MYNYFKSKFISGFDSVPDSFKMSRSVQLGGQTHLVMNIHEFRVQGEFDKISDGEGIVICNEPGSNRRCGGQGDLLTGMIATFLHFGMKQKIDSAPVLAAYTASTVKS